LLKNKQSIRVCVTKKKDFHFATIINQLYILYANIIPTNYLRILNTIEKSSQFIYLFKYYYTIIHKKSARMRFCYF